MNQLGDGMGLLTKEQNGKIFMYCTPQLVQA